jgi:hypothetical protein
MYCATCGTPRASGLSYCNRCGASLKERADSKTGAITAFLIAISLIGVAGLGIMLGGALTLTREAHLDGALVGFFMLFTFLIVGITEILLVRQLSRLTGAGDIRGMDAPQQFVMPAEFQPNPVRTLPDPIPSITENTTRTLEYSRNEILK